MPPRPPTDPSGPATPAEPRRASPRLRLGAAAEAEACQHLERAGLTLVAKNWRGPGRHELDLVMRDGDTAVAVEVRAQSARGRGFAGHPAFTVGPDKQRRIRLAAWAWFRAAREGALPLEGWTPQGLRIDVVTLIREQAGAWTLRWFRAAFE